MNILAIETSCDETAASIIEVNGDQPKVLTNAVASQIADHAATGGVVPNLAARLHTENLPRILNEATRNITIDFDAVAVTAGPGLVGCLLIGLAAAKTIASVTGKPFFAINHLEGHIYSAWLGEKTPELPALIVIVSGGHTELILMRNHLQYELLGATRDDAAGEAFDKVARVLDLGYPGGPAVSALAREGDENAFALPFPLHDSPNLDFSFSGLKAAVAFTAQKLAQPISLTTKADLAASFQAKVCEVISKRTTQALTRHPEVKTVILVGGVAANSQLRTHLAQAVANEFPDVATITAPLEYCTDNAAMIGAAAAFHHLYGQPDRWQDTEADPNLSL